MTVGFFARDDLQRPGTVGFSGCLIGPRRSPFRSTLPIGRRGFFVSGRSKNKETTCQFLPLFFQELCRRDVAVEGLNEILIISSVQVGFNRIPCHDVVLEDNGDGGFLAATRVCG